MLFKIGVVKKFAIFTGKHLRQSLFFTKVQDRRLAKHYKSGDLEYNKEQGHQESSSKRGTVHQQIVSG